MYYIKGASYNCILPKFMYLIKHTVHFMLEAKI